MRTAAAVLIVFVLIGCNGSVGLSPRTTVSATDDAVPNPTPEGRNGIEGLQAYGQDHVDEFGGMYIDPPGGRHVVMLFTANVDEHAHAVEAIQPGTTVRAVEHTEAELAALIEGFDFDSLRAQGVEMLSASVDVINNRATLEAKSTDLTAEARLELSFGGLLDVTIYPVPGEWHNVGEGDGWRLLAAGEGDIEAYTVHAATDATSWDALWEEVGLGGATPEVGLQEEVVVAFGHGIGIGCREVRLDDVVIDAGIVWSVTSDPLLPRNCDAALVGTHVFVVAIAREAVPDDGFTLWLNEYAASRGGEFSAALDAELP